MRAVQDRHIGKGPEVVEIDKPEPGPGQIRLRVTAAGLCHSDLGLMSRPADVYEYGLPLTLGHEGAGTVDKLGPGVSGIEVGESFAVYGPRGCGSCRACSRGEENYCPHAAELGIKPPGLGEPGALADYMIVHDKRFLVPLAGLDPIKAVSLTDAGLTPYHAIRSSQGKLFPGAHAVVIGVGGLGHVAVQIIRAITGATVVAVDLNKDRLDMALDVGAHHALIAGDRTADEIRTLTGVAGAQVVFDFAGAQSTLDLATDVVSVDGCIQIVGIGGGSVTTGFGHTPLGVSVRAPYWGSRSELAEVLDLARAGLVEVHVEEFALEDAVDAYRKLAAGELLGRAVIVP